jgi:hypothetical protein
MLHFFDPLLQFRIAEEVPNTLANAEVALPQHERRTASYRSRRVNNMTASVSFQALG